MIVAGFGFRGAAGVESLFDALTRTGLTPDALATAQVKADSPAFRALAAAQDLPIVAVAPDDLTAQTTPTQSDASQHAHGTGSVAEAAALAAAGPGAQLLTARVISEDQMATCAVAKKADP